MRTPAIPRIPSLRMATSNAALSPPGPAHDGCLRSPPSQREAARGGGGLPPPPASTAWLPSGAITHRCRSRHPITSASGR